ncbi:MAG: esterase-like activity of phytase family protein [Alphaproteobacteria bacterium]
MSKRIIRRALAVLALLAAAPAAADPITIIAQQVPLDPRNANVTTVGALAFRGGLALRSPDKRFGGFSDLFVAPSGNFLLTISDRGTWLRANLVYDERGRLIGMRDGDIGPLIDAEGKPLTGTAADAEAMAVLPDGSILVAFERQHRLWLYPAAEPPFSKPPKEFPAPPNLEDSPGNSGIESLMYVGGDYFIAITEKMRASGNAVVGWVGRLSGWETFAYERTGSFFPTAGQMLWTGDLLMLERSYDPVSGAAMRLQILKRREIAPGMRLRGQELARLEKPLTVDNFEGLGLRHDKARRETLVYVMSDDNFNPLQRTLLLMFALPD